MAIVLFILLLVYVLYRVYRNKVIRDRAADQVMQPSDDTNERSKDDYSLEETVEKPELVACTHVRIWQRRTYIRGVLLSKFNGELDTIKDLQQLVRERYFNILLYDARIEQAEFRRNNEGPFPESMDGEAWPGPIEPNPLPCKVAYQGIDGEFAVLLQDVRLWDIDFSKHRLLHMEEDDLVFGMMEAKVTGYLVEHFKEEYMVSIPVTDAKGKEAKEPDLGTVAVDGERLSGELVGEYTGRTKVTGGYRWREHRRLGRDSSEWRQPMYVARTRNGCGAVVGIVFMVFFVFVFFAAIGPQGILILLALAAAGLLVSFFSSLFRPLLWVLTLGLVAMAVASLVKRVSKGPDIVRIPFSRDESRETEFVMRKRSVRKDAVGRDSAASGLDSLIVHHRVWKDYDDSVYEGDIWVRSNDCLESGGYKNRLSVPENAMSGYDRMLKALYTNDRTLLPGVCHLLDSIQTRRKLDGITFAKVVVSFVQDIPYALVLDRDCNPDLYSDPFTRRYLQTADAQCFGCQRFGINTPVEFMGTLKGDCDTRTLLLYTLLDHYGYDVAIMSSEVYSHSLLGIVLPLAGTAYVYQGKSYVLWETTTLGLPPGVIAPAISDLSKWRVSLTSKN